MYKLFLVFLFAACNKKNIFYLVCFRQTIESLVDPKLFISYIRSYLFLLAYLTHLML